jgi:hypothetical protein
MAQDKSISMKAAAISVGILLLIGGFACAIGSSSGGGSSYSKPSTTLPRAAPPTTLPTTTLQAATGSTVASAPPTSAPKADCEAYPTVKERVKCRLETNDQTESVPEQCRGIPSQASCISLHKTAKPCYSMAGAEKDKCLRKLAGIGGSIEKSKANSGGMRLYAVLLTYDLQERVEDAYSKGKVSSDSAASLVDQIVAIKRSLLTGGKKETVLPIIQSLRTSMQDLGVQ